MSSGRSRLFRLLAIASATLAVAGLVAAHVAARQIESRLVAALGPRASVGGVSVGLASVTVTDLRIASAGRAAWPADDELRAAELVVRPGLRSLWSALHGGPWFVGEIVVRDGFVSALRTHDGRLHAVPALMERAGEAPAGGTRATDAPPSAATPLIEIGEIRLEHTAVEFDDASLKTAAPHRLRFEDLDARIGPLDLPTLARPVSLRLEARLKGVERDGDVALHGTLTPATKDADLAFRVKDVDLVALQPYLFRLNDGGVRHGRLDLAIDARVEHQRLHAPGNVTITGLELSPGGGTLGGLGSGSRQALLDLMRHDGRLSAKFVLDGRLDDPAFSLNENLATRFASGVGDTLGVGVQGVVQGMGHVLKGLVGR